MNRKQLIILLTLVILLGGALWFFQRPQTSRFAPTSSGMGSKLLGDFDVNKVARIDLKQGTNEVNLVKKDDLWRVRERYDYPAAYSQISDFLLKVRDLKVVQTEDVGASQLPRLSLVPGQGTNAALVVDFMDQSDKSMKTLLLGKQLMKKSKGGPEMGEMGGDTGYPDGRYVKVGADSPNVAVINEGLSLEPRPEPWLNRDFFKVEKIKDISVTYPVATNSWKVSRATENATEWKLSDAKPGELLDSGKSSGLSYALNSPTFSDVLPSNANPAPAGLDKPTMVTFDTFDNFTYTVKVGSKTNENYPVTVTVAADLPKDRTPGKDEKPEEKTKLDKEFKDNQKKLQDKLAQEKSCEKWVYLISTWTLDPVMKERAQLLVEKKEEPKKEDKASTNSVAIPQLEPPITKAAETNSTAE
jgi:hypothetical protein